MIAIKPSISLLRGAEIFAGASDRELGLLWDHIDEVNLAPSTYLFRKGDTGDALFILATGELVSTTEVEGKERPLSTIHVGEVFGEVSLLDRGPRSASVQAARASAVLKLTTESFSKITREAPALASSI